ncbi:MAG TPA: hypothetical protein VFA94_02350, partial [Acidimicrobiales bacterium]|nr:hypothetical protein [Acidimicrobiales bacterium]
ACQPAPPRPPTAGLHPDRLPTPYQTLPQVDPLHADTIDVQHALIPPPLSRSHRDAQLEEARQVKADVDRFLALLDDELAPGPVCARRPAPRVTADLG